ncbi:MAG: four-helix bundle copper-binding protein [Paracoccaceae bacterium]
MSNPDDMRACIDACLDCYRTCTATAMTYCLEMGGDHTPPGHFRLMMACSEICRTAAHMMLIHFDGHARICRECAESAPDAPMIAMPCRGWSLARPPVGPARRPVTGWPPWT